MPEDIYGIGIETSCDETGIAVIKNGTEIISNPVYSQIATHREYGGVVPELASRLHLEKFPEILEQILTDVPGVLSKISYIAVTVRPGLSGSLLTGYYIALALHRVTGKPVIPVNHIEAHFYANTIGRGEFTYPFLGLLLSGGNSSLYKINGLGDIRLLGDTLDDACGEALDKAAAMLGLSYPGGPEIEKRAMAYASREIKKEEKNPFPEMLKDMKNSEYHFSFSGLKTALYYYLQKNPGPDVDFISWCFQERAFGIVVRNVRNAVENTGIRKVIAAGGVMANKTLNSRLNALAEKKRFTVVSPPPALCTDNGAMIGALGYEYFKAGRIAEIDRVISSKSGFL